MDDFIPKDFEGNGCDDAEAADGDFKSAEEARVLRVGELGHSTVCQDGGQADHLHTYVTSARGMLINCAN